MTARGDTVSAELAAGRTAALAAITEVADGWGADWRPDEAASDGSTGGSGVGGSADPGSGRLVLPRVAGLHRGILVGRIQLYPGSAGEAEPDPVRAAASRTRVVFEVEAVQDHVHLAAVVILALAAFGALLTVVWPFFPSLLPVAPFGALLALGGWFLVISRLQNSGPEEFFHLVEETLAEDPAGAGPADAGPTGTGPTETEPAAGEPA